MMCQNLDWTTQLGEAFGGTGIVISPARSLLDRTPDRIVEVRDGRLESSVGGYDDWAAARR
jgi:ATPase subunit of ABC transporter with duplicated ATPase domains